MNAKKTKLGREEAIRLAKEADELYVVKGKKVTHIDLRKSRPDDDTLAGLLLGPTGNLRAPTLRRGRTLIVGFDAETYRKIM